MSLVAQSVTRAISRSVLIGKKNSPHIFFAGGIIGAVTSTVLACRATLKLEPIIDEMKTDLSVVKEIKGDPEYGIDLGYTRQDYVRDLAYVYGKNAKKLAVLYGPSVILGVASISALTGSHVQMTRRNSALTATVAAVSKAYDDYRTHVQDELGKEKELELYKALKTESTKDENGKESKQVISAFGNSPYARVFDETCPEWRKDPEYNRTFIQCQQNYANHLLTHRGHVFLNDVYDSLGFERTSAGAVVGWVRNSDGDGYIDFNIFESEHNNRFVNGLERSVWLDFNVDGVIYDKI